MSSFAWFDGLFDYILFSKNVVKSHLFLLETKAFIYAYIELDCKERDSDKPI
jgi:hypothetical protein